MPQNPPPGLTVVVASRDRGELLRGALEALGRHLRPQDQVIVVDSASKSPGVEQAASEAGVRLIKLSRPGTSRARNAGLAAASTTIVAFIDDDCLITPGWSESLEEAFADEQLGFVTGRVEPDRPASVSLSVFLEEAPRRFDRVVDPSAYGGGSNMAFRRSALASVGGFDEGMGPATALRAAEDQDAFWRVVRAGWAGAYHPSIVVTHRQWRTGRQALRRQYDYGVGAAAVAVKAIRLDDRSGWRMLRTRLWAEGFGLAWRNLLRRYESGVVAALVRVAGVLAGTFIAWVRPLVDGRYRGA